MALTLEQALASLRVVSLPMRTKFRGLTQRETALIQGPNGWGEFASFIEYDNKESLPWLNSAIEAATIDLSAPLQEFFQLETTPENRESEGLFKVFAENFPITDTRNQFVLEFLDYFIDPPRYTIE